MKELSNRIRNITPSATSSMIAAIAEKKKSGADIIGFNAGEPDFDTPQAVVDACVDAMKEGRTKYETVSGIEALRKAICEKLKRDNGLDYEPKQIVVSTGAKQALYNALMAIVGDGDEVIVPTPCWVSYVEIIKLAGGVPVLVETNEDYSINVEKIAEAVTEKTKALVINTPNNPTGAVYGEETLTELAKLAEENDFYIVSDEVYEKLIYGDAGHVSIASVSDDAKERTIIINGFSKAFSMTGWRIGYSASSLEISSAITSFQGHVSSNSTSFVQYAAVKALEECDDEVEAMRAEFAKRRDYMYERLNAMEGVKCEKPDGAFYLMPDISSYFGKKYDGGVINDSSDFCRYLLDEAGVAIVPGDAFYMPGTVRFAYSTSAEEIKEGMDRMEKALAGLRG